MELIAPVLTLEGGRQRRGYHGTFIEEAREARPRQGVEQRDHIQVLSLRPGRAALDGRPQAYAQATHVAPHVRLGDRQCP